MTVVHWADRPLFDPVTLSEATFDVYDPKHSFGNKATVLRLGSQFTTDMELLNSKDRHLLFVCCALQMRDKPSPALGKDAEYIGRTVTARKTFSLQTTVYPGYPVIYSGVDNGGRRLVGDLFSVSGSQISVLDRIRVGSKYLTRETISVKINPNLQDNKNETNSVEAFTYLVSTLPNRLEPSNVRPCPVKHIRFVGEVQYYDPPVVH